MDRKRMKALFKYIAAGFNLTDGEIETVLKYSDAELQKALQECFQQIENPRTHFKPDDYVFLKEVVGCRNLKEELYAEPLTENTTHEHLVVETLFDMPIQFTLSELYTQVYLKCKCEIQDTVDNIVRMLSHPNVKILAKQGEFYSINHEAVIKTRRTQ